MGHIVGFPASRAAGGAPPTTDLVLWLKADEGVYNDAGTTLATNGQTVQQWNDFSGNSYHASQATSGSRPAFNTGSLNGLPGIAFDSKFMTVANNADLALNADSSIFVVIQGAFMDSNVMSIISKDNNASAGAYLYYLTTIAGGFPNIDRPFIAAGTKANNTAGTSLIAAIISGSTVSYYRNGASDGVQSLVTGTATTKDLMIGAFGNGSQNVLKATLHEIVLFKSALGSTARDAWTSYLRGKWGV
jgi:hypothetical protein